METVNSKRRKKEWSATSAARTAREARIATVRFLRDAPLARKLQMQKLIAAYKMKLGHIRDENAAALLLLTGLGYKQPFPQSWPETTELVIRDEAHYLSHADVYVLSPQMCDVVIAAAQTLTRDDIELLDADDLPSRSGIVMLPHPVVVRTISGDLSDDRAFTWHTPFSIQHPSDDHKRLEDISAVRISTYHDRHGPVQPDAFLELVDYAEAVGTPLPPLMLDAIRGIPFRYTVREDQKRSLEEFAEHARSTGERARAWDIAHDRDENRVVGEYTPGTEIQDYDDSFAIRFLYAFWRLCEQRTATAEDAAINHSARVLSERHRVSPDVRVVQLRESPQRSDGESGKRDWQHRWVVRMHKVRQWYPSIGRHRVIYRGPYPKGPADKPFLGGEVIRAVTR